MNGQELDTLSFLYFPLEHYGGTLSFKIISICMTKLYFFNLILRVLEVSPQSPIRKMF